jgi:hypothetical protein
VNALSVATVQSTAYVLSPSGSSRVQMICNTLAGECHMWLSCSAMHGLKGRCRDCMHHTVLKYYKSYLCTTVLHCNVESRAQWHACSTHQAVADRVVNVQRWLEAYTGIRQRVSRSHAMRCKRISTFKHSCMCMCSHCETLTASSNKNLPEREYSHEPASWRKYACKVSALAQWHHAECQRSRASLETH